MVLPLCDSLGKWYGMGKKWYYHHVNGESLGGWLILLTRRRTNTHGPARNCTKLPSTSTIFKFAAQGRDWPACLRPAVRGGRLVRYPRLNIYYMASTTTLAPYASLTFPVVPSTCTIREKIRLSNPTETPAQPVWYGILVFYHFLILW